MTSVKTKVILGLVLFVLVGVIIFFSVLLATNFKCLIHSSKFSQQVDHNSSSFTTSESFDSSSLLNQMRLPRTIRPQYYDIYLDIDPNQTSFTGHETIIINVDIETDYFVVHSSKLNITRVEVNKERNVNNNVLVPVRDHFNLPANDFYIIQLEQAVAKGNYSLKFQFDGTLGTDPGIYRDSYLNTITNETSYYVSTFLQPTEARAVFPCFDEPFFKSVFRIRLRHPKHLISLSNMNIESHYMDEEHIIVTFAPTPPMSSYLVCVVVGDFLHTGNNELSVYALPDQIHLAKFAENFGLKALRFLAEYFDIPYSLPKLDFIALPLFFAGGMENWGLITYQDYSLLIDDQDILPTTEQHVAVLIAHELSHQWFGNLVTMEWWNDLWLNEGFSTYFSYYAISEIEPGWNMNADLYCGTTLTVLKLDHDSISRPIVQPVNSREEIREMFDWISYDKASAVIRMMKSILGEDNFKRGIQIYLKKHAFSHVTTKDLWNAMALVSKEVNLTDFMETWLLQKGYPVIHVHRRKSHFTLSQSPFFPDSKGNYNKSESPFEYLWEIPVFYQTDTSDELQFIWMHKETNISFDLPDAFNSKWVKFNARTLGTYRVNYDVDDWNRFIDMLNTFSNSFLSEEDRAGLLADAFALAEADFISYEIPFQMLSYLKNETAYVPWKVVSQYLEKFLRSVNDEEIYHEFRVYVSSLVSPVLDVISWIDKGDHSTKKLRTVLMELLCTLENKRCLEKSSSELKNYLLYQKPMSPSFVDINFSFGMLTLGPNEWNSLWLLYQKETNDYRKILMIRGLSSSTSTPLLHTLLNDTLNSSYYDFVIYSLSKHPFSANLTWNFIQNNWTEIIRSGAINETDLFKTVLIVTGEFSTETRLCEVVHFFTLHPQLEIEKDVVDNIRKNIEWKKKYSEVIRNWLNSAKN